MMDNASKDEPHAPQHPEGRGFFLAVAAAIAVFMLLEFVVPQGVLTPYLRALVQLVIAILWLLFYRHSRIREDGMAPDDLKGSRFIGDTVLGAVLGAGLAALTILTIGLSATVSISWSGSLLAVLPFLARAIGVGVFEEVISRGLLFRYLEKHWGSARALAASSLVFGLLHFPNSGFSVMAGLGVVAAGVLLGAAYMASRSLWLAIAIHIAWNFTEGGIFGASVSGHEVPPSLFVTHFDGPVLLTGGSFGPEASLGGVIVVAVAAALMTVFAWRQGQFRVAQRR